MLHTQELIDNKFKIHKMLKAHLELQDSDELSINPSTGQVVQILDNDLFNNICYILSIRLIPKGLYVVDIVIDLKLQKSDYIVSTIYSNN